MYITVKRFFEIHKFYIRMTFNNWDSQARQTNLGVNLQVKSAPPPQPPNLGLGLILATPRCQIQALLPKLQRQIQFCNIPFLFLLIHSTNLLNLLLSISSCYILSSTQLLYSYSSSTSFHSSIYSVKHPSGLSERWLGFTIIALHLFFPTPYSLLSPHVPPSPPSLP